jgi:hypothetical protein
LYWLFHGYKKGFIDSKHSCFRNWNYAPGASAPVNAGTVKNSGIEFSVDYKKYLSDNFSMSAVIMLLSWK